MNGSVLVVASHPDDEVLGCGGTIADWSARGRDVHILILGEGATSRYDDPADAPVAELEALHEQSRRAAKVLGAASHRIAGLPDNRFDTVAMLDIIKIVERCVAQHEPDTVLVQHGGDLNVDHAATYRATLTATRPIGPSGVKRVLAFPVGSSTEWAFGSFAPRFTPQHFVEIGSTLDCKLEAMACYELEARPPPHPRAPEVLRATAAFWGSHAGLQAAEPFQVVRSIEPSG